MFQSSSSLPTLSQLERSFEQRPSVQKTLEKVEQFLQRPPSIVTVNKRKESNSILDYEDEQNDNKTCQDTHEV